MTVRIDYSRCNGCPKRAEACCEEVCPGNLLYRSGGKAQLRDRAECWDCFACVKVCPLGALSVELPFQISEARNTLSARMASHHIIWTLRDRTGAVIQTYIIQNRVDESGTKPRSSAVSEKEMDVP
ncbi:MAG: hypothetical protein N3B18_08520 [Desulfobacterota bacterium]|nr:hypothetical protein [Thermodesulfobacteriota bacterium]